MKSVYTENNNERIRPTRPRLNPIPENEWTEEQRLALQTFKRKDGRVMNVFTTIARNIKLAGKYFPFTRYLLFESSLPFREREILILRIGWLCRSEYEFGQHTRIARRSGLTDEEILRITKGPDDPAWDPFDAALLRAVDELYADACITDDTWNTLAERYNENQLIDLIMTVGQYNLVSMFLNTAGVRRDEGVAGFPDSPAR